MTTRTPRTRARRDLLKEDVTEMIRERFATATPIRKDAAEELAHDLIVVIRERFLREIESYARENIR